VPADRPRAAVLVMLDEPKNGYYGGAVAAPVFQKIAAYLITRWRLTPEAAQ
jgi:cell division protein FtsI (penicillin-binding protein 3)